MIKTDKNNLFCVKPNGYACAHNARDCKPCGFRLLHYVRRLRSVPARFTQNKEKPLKTHVQCKRFECQLQKVMSHGFFMVFLLLRVKRPVTAVAAGIKGETKAGRLSGSTLRPAANPIGLHPQQVF